MDIEEILKAKLATISEEPEVCEENGSGKVLAKHMFMSKNKNKMHLKVRIGRLLNPKFSIKDSYVLFISGFVSKGRLGGIPRY